MRKYNRFARLGFVFCFMTGFAAGMEAASFWGRAAQRSDPKRHSGQREMLP